MNLGGGRGTMNKAGFEFNLNGGQSHGPKHIVRAARDPISIPTEPVIVELAKKNLCILGLGVNCYKLTNVYGVERDVPYNASVEQWARIAKELLDLAMRENDGE